MERWDASIYRVSRKGSKNRACRRPAGDGRLGAQVANQMLGRDFPDQYLQLVGPILFFVSHFVLLERCLTCSLLRHNSHTIKVTIFKCTISVFWYTCKVVQLSPQSNSRTFSSHLQRCPIPISSHSLFPLPSAPSNC